MRAPVSLGTMTAFVEALAVALPFSTDLYVIGGTALLLTGATRSTLDVDIVGNDLQEAQTPLERQLLNVAAAQSLDVELVPFGGFVPALRGAESRHRLLIERHSVRLWMFDPVAIALSKLDRASPSDLDDLRYMLRAGLVASAQLDAALDEIDGKAKAFDLDLPAMRRRWFTVSGRRSAS